MTAIEIPLTRGFVALVDEADAERVLTRKWHLSPTRATNYAIASRRMADGDGPSTIMMHRFITGLTPLDPYEIDHQDGNGLNNQRSNLRQATHSQNIFYGKARKPTYNKHGYRGIICLRGRFYFGRLVVHGHAYHTKSFRTPMDAAKAWDELALKHYGEFAAFNFPPQNFLPPQSRNFDAPSATIEAATACQKKFAVSVPPSEISRFTTEDFPQPTEAGGT